MSTIGKIRHAITQIPVNQPFTSQFLSPCGSRASIDTAVYRLIKKGEIVRLAHGIFIQSEAKDQLAESFVITHSKTYERTVVLSRPPVESQTLASVSQSLEAHGPGANSDKLRQRSAWRKSTRTISIVNAGEVAMLPELNRLA